MSWKFWEKSKAQAPATSLIDWNTDAYGSVKFLFGMYVKNTPPFCEWREKDASLLPEVEEVASTNAKAYQLWLWFAMYRQRRGTVECVMLRDAFISLFDAVAPDDRLGVQMRWLLDFQDKSLEYVHDLSAEKKTAMESEAGAELPAEYYIAMYQLLAFPDSPYSVGKEELKQHQQNAFCICLLNAKIKARTFFEPMLDAIQMFDATDIPHWEWSVPIGPRERHLQRRHNNPLFIPERRFVTAADVYEARLLDTKAHDGALKAVEEIRQELQTTELPPTWFAYLNDKRETIESVHEQIVTLGTYGDDIRPMCERLRAYVVGIMQDVLAKEDPKRAAIVEEAEKLHAQREKMFSSPFVRQMLHPDKFIPPAEVIAAILSEDIESMTVIVKTMTGDPDFAEALSSVKSGALDAIRLARAANYEIPSVDEKLAVLGVSL